MKLRLAAAILIIYSTLMIQRAMPDLPERIPTNFNFRGQATATSRPETLWLLLAGQALTVALLLAVPYLARHAPQWVNLGRKRLSDFPPAARARFMPLIEGMCGWLAVTFAFFFTMLIRQLVRAAQNPGRGPGFWSIPAFLAVVGGLTAYYLWRFYELNQALAESVPERRSQT